MKPLASKTKFYITLFIIAAIILGIIFGIAMPILWKIKAESENILKIKQQITDIEAKRNQLLKIEKEFEAIKDTLKRIDAALKDPAKFLDIIIELEKLAENSGNKHQITIAEERTKTAAPAEYLLFRIILTGPFESAMNFISTLENENFYSQIEKIEMSKIDKLTVEQITEDAQIGDIKTTMEVKVFTR